MISFTLEEWEQVKITIDNIWRVQSTKKNARGHLVYYYECMIGKSADSLDPPRSRKTKVKRLHDCSMKMIVKHLADSVVVYTTTESQHSHSLDDCDRLRHPRVVSAIIKTETQGRDDWSSASVAHNLPQATVAHFGVDLLSRDYLNASVDYKKVCNARRKFLPKSSGPRRYTQDEIVGHLRENGYLAKSFSYGNGDFSSIAFVESEFACKVLVADCGSFCLMDSTHGMVSKDDSMKLTTIYLKHNCGKWFAGGQFWLPKENSDGIESGTSFSCRSPCCERIS